MILPPARASASTKSPRRSASAAGRRVNRAATHDWIAFAIKICNAACSERFEPEAIAALNHRHVYQIDNVGPNDLVMELIEGVAGFHWRRVTTGGIRRSKAG